MVSCFKEKLKNQTSKSLEQLYLLFLKFTSEFPIDPSHFRKIKLHPVRDRVDIDIHTIRYTSVENEYRTKKVILLWAKNMVKNKP